MKLHVCTIFLLPIYSYFAVQCPMSWKVTNNKCYSIFTEFGLSNPQKINQFCDSQGGYIFVVDSEEQNQQLLEEANLSGGEYLLLGCRDANKEGQWSCNGRSTYIKHWTNDSHAGFWSKIIVIFQYFFHTMQ